MTATYKMDKNGILNIWDCKISPTKVGEYYDPEPHQVVRNTTHTNEILDTLTAKQELDILGGWTVHTNTPPLTVEDAPAIATQETLRAQYKSLDNKKQAIFEQIAALTHEQYIGSARDLFAEADRIIATQATICTQLDTLRAKPAWDNRRRAREGSPKG